MKSIIRLAIALAVGSIGVAAIAAPTCNITTNGDKVTVAIADTGIVYRSDLKQSPPAGTIAYQGTGRKVDRSVSCKDNPKLCADAKWFLRFADAKQGWVGDNDLQVDQRVVACSYDATRLAQVCEFVMTDAQKTKKGDVRMHYSALVDKTVVAAYEPQGGNCYVEKDGRGNPHTIVSAVPPAAAK